MTVLEELAQILPTLHVEEQRSVLDLATRLRNSRRPAEISFPAADADDAAWDAWRRRVRARSVVVLEDEKQRLQASGLIDERWNALTEELPADMLPTSETSVET